MTDYTMHRSDPSGSASPTWAIVFGRELRDLWVGGKALLMILIYCILLGVYSYSLAANADVKLLPLSEMILEMVKAAIAVGVFICLVIGADSFSGDRERMTLETLLLTPASRRQIVLGKFLAALSPWPVALALAVPYWALLSKGDPVFGQALLWGTVIGSLLAPALAAVGLLVSIWCSSNKTSMLVSLCLYLLFLLPTELSRPGRFETYLEVRRGLLYQFMNPWDAASKLLFTLFVNQVPVGQVWLLAIVPAAFTALVIALLFLSASRHLRLQPGLGARIRSYWVRWTHAPGAPRPRPVLREGAREPANPLPEPRISSQPRILRSRGEPSGRALPTWWVVFRKELRDLWIGGKALHLTVAYAVVLGVYAYIMARDSTLRFMPPKEMVFELTKAAIVASVFVGLIIGADSLSGERERATLEGLLVTPTSRRQIMLGKFLAAASPGPISLAITIPFMRFLSQGDEVFGQAVMWGAGLGVILTLSFTALAMFVGFWCNSNKTSLFVSLCLFLLFLLPTQLPGHAQGGTMGLFMQWVNPLEAQRYYLALILVNNGTVAQSWSWLWSPLVFSVLVLGLLFLYASPGLRLEAAKKLRFSWTRARTAGAVLIAALLPFRGAAATALAQQPAPAVAGSPLTVSIDVQAKTVRAGTPVLYNTVVTNTGTATTTPLIVAMNIINLNAKGDVVDPEDWSPQRTQYADPIAPGQAVSLSWRINAILDGDYMVYMVAIPAPSAPEATSHPATSPGIHLVVTKYTRLNPGGVLPYAVGGPVVLGLIIFFVYRRRHREIDAGGSE